MTPEGGSSPRDPRADRIPAPSRLRRFGEFVRRVVSKADEDNIFFMAGAIAFNLVIGVVPLVLLAIGISGFALRARFSDPSGYVIGLLLGLLPAATGEVDLVQAGRGFVDRLIEGRTGFSLVGAVVLVWVSTRLVGTVRTALREVFDVAQDRGPIRGKLFDAQIVVLGGVLVLVNAGLTALVFSVRDVGVQSFALPGWGVWLATTGVAEILSFSSIWVLFLLSYRYLTVRRIPWRTVLVAATFSAILYELMKAGFGWYVTEVAVYRSAYGNLATIAVFVFYVYYLSVGFILGGEVGQVYTMRSAVRSHRVASAASAASAASGSNAGASTSVGGPPEEAAERPGGGTPGGGVRDAGDPGSDPETDRGV